jgi:hypothetical protein
MRKAVIKIFRKCKDDKQTSGSCKIYDGDGFEIFNSLSLERGWNDNKVRVSSIPPGEYDVVLEYSPKFGRKLWEIKNVPGRSECKFHSAIFWYHLQGCIALGISYININSDGYLDLLYSSQTMEAFHEVLKQFDSVKLIIKDNTDS